MSPSPAGWLLHELLGHIPSLVGAGLPAMVVNDDAHGLVNRGVLGIVASRLAPTEFCEFH
ncbi:hypothetical protein C4E44_30225 [Pseudomonas sp. MWU12-2312b]|nr:hypothetical protein C4E44_30225 [Pseudomonas sp. MWU12-2312b]